MKAVEFFGSRAGKVWGALNEASKKSMNVVQLKKATKLKSEHVYGALGWLAREGKVEMQKNKFILLE